MCGEFEEEDYIDDQLFGRLLQMADKYGVTPGEAGDSGPPDLTTQEARSHYMTGLFQAGLTRSLTDSNNLPPEREWTESPARRSRLHAWQGSWLVSFHRAQMFCGRLSTR